MEKLLVEVSARHIHLTKEHVNILFGEGYELTFRKELSQPGQFATNDKVVLVGPKSEMALTVLGPERNVTQAEVSLTDARVLGIKAPIRESGDVAGSTGITLKGPKGTVEIQEGVIVAKRHVHMEPKDAEYYGVKNGDVIGVAIETDGRSIVFNDTVVRVSESYRLAMHIDTDEANGANIGGNVFGSVVK